MSLYLGTVQYVVPFVFASLCYFLIIRLIIFHIPFMLFLVLCFCFLFHVFCAFILFFVLFFLLYIDVSFVFSYKYTDYCHRLETQLQ